jgi:hypothetical protein
MINLTKFALCLDIEKGDILLAGKYKNKRMEVEKIDTDELGQPTVNGQKLLAVRIEKELPKDKMSSQTQEEMKKESNMNWLQKIAQTAFDEEMDNLLESQGEHNITTNKFINKIPRINRGGSNVGIADEYNPTETESDYGQAL